MADRSTPVAVNLQDFNESCGIYVFADIRGFTQWSSMYQNEIRRLTAALYSVAASTFGTRKSTRNLRRIVKFLGDGFFAVSEYDDDREGDLQHRLAETVEAVVGFNDSFLSLIERSNLHERRSIAVGYGMSFGASYRFHTAGQPIDFIGHEVNLASRLCSVATPSELIVEREIRDRLDLPSDNVLSHLAFTDDDIELRSFGVTRVSRAQVGAAVQKRISTTAWVADFVNTISELLAKQARIAGESA